MTELEHLELEEKILRTKLRENSQRQLQLRRAEFLSKHNIYLGMDVEFMGRKARIVDVEDVGGGVLVPVYVRFRSNGQAGATRQKIWPHDMKHMKFYEDSH